MSHPSRPPTFLNLPTELHFSIISFLPYPSIHPLLATNRYFHQLLNDTQLSRLRKNYTASLVDEEAADWDQHTRFICYECFQWKSLAGFVEKQYSKRRAKGHADCHKRFCIECGIGRRKWHPGQFLKSGGMDLVVCRTCRMLEPSDGNSRLRGLCIKCARSDQGEAGPDLAALGVSETALSLRGVVGKF